MTNTTNYERLVIRTRWELDALRRLELEVEEILPPGHSRGRLVLRASENVLPHALYAAAVTAQRAVSSSANWLPSSLDGRVLRMDALVMGPVTPAAFNVGDDIAVDWAPATVELDDGLKSSVEGHTSAIIAAAVAKSADADRPSLRARLHRASEEVQRSVREWCRLGYDDAAIMAIAEAAIELTIAKVKYHMREPHSIAAAMPTGSPLSGILRRRQVPRGGAPADTPRDGNHDHEMRGPSGPAS